MAFERRMRPGVSERQVTPIAAGSNNNEPDLAKVAWHVPSSISAKKYRGNYQHNNNWR